jgi:hypothetical protein
MLNCANENEKVPMILIVDDSNQNIQKQVLMMPVALSEIDGMVTNVEEKKAVEKTYECPAGSTLVKVDFNEFERGQYVNALTSTLRVKAEGKDGKGYTPEGKARVFDSNDPTGGDWDLGSPNKSCGSDKDDFPGVGEDGRKGRPGENCKDLGNLLIIQEAAGSEPDDLGKPGGKFTFSTTGYTEMTFLGVGVLDIDEVDVTLGVNNNAVKYPGLGDNAFQELENTDTKKFVQSFDVSMPGSGAVAYLVSSIGLVTWSGSDNLDTHHLLFLFPTTRCFAKGQQVTLRALLDLLVDLLDTVALLWDGTLVSRWISAGIPIGWTLLMLGLNIMVINQPIFPFLGNSRLNALLAMKPRSQLKRLAMCVSRVATALKSTHWKLESHIMVSHPLKTIVASLLTSVTLNSAS